MTNRKPRVTISFNESELRELMTLRSNYSWSLKKKINLNYCKLSNIWVDHDIGDISPMLLNNKFVGKTTKRG